MHYRLEGSTDLKVIGKSDQIETCYFPVHIDTDSRSSKGFWYEFADLSKLIFPEPILHNKAKLTDFIPCHVIGTRDMPLVSQKLMRIIENVNNNNPQFIPARLHHKGQILNNYYFLNAFDFLPNTIDFKNSTLCYRSYKKPPDGERIKVETLEDFLEIQHKIKPPVGLQIRPIVLNSFAENYDFFTLKWVYGSGYFVSQKFVDITKNEMISGIRFMELNEHY